MKNLIETRLQVVGMTCGSCVRHVGDALRAVPGVAAAEVDLREGEALVQHDPGMAPTARLIAAVEEAGYEAAQAA